MPAFAGMTNFHFAEQTIVSGFGYLIYAAYLAEVEHKGSPFTRAVGGHFQVLLQEISVRSANRPKQADEAPLGKRSAVCDC